MNACESCRAVLYADGTCPRCHRPRLAVVAVVAGLFVLCVAVLIAAWPAPAEAEQPPDAGLRPVVTEPAPGSIPASLIRESAR